MITPLRRGAPPGSGAVRPLSGRPAAGSEYPCSVPGMRSVVRARHRGAGVSWRRRNVRMPDVAAGGGGSADAVAAGHRPCNPCAGSSRGTGIRNAHSVDLRGFRWFGHRPPAPDPAASSPTFAMCRSETAMVRSGGAVGVAAHAAADFLPARRSPGVRPVSGRAPRREHERQDRDRRPDGCDSTHVTLRGARPGRDVRCAGPRRVTVAPVDVRQPAAGGRAPPPSYRRGDDAVTSSAGRSPPCRRRTRGRSHRG